MISSEYSFTILARTYLNLFLLEIDKQSPIFCLQDIAPYIGARTSQRNDQAFIWSALWKSCRSDVAAFVRKTHYTDQAGKRDPHGALHAFYSKPVYLAKK